MEKPVIMVSSTYYDLKQVRTDLKIFIEHLGYEPLLSELSSFPISHNIETIPNCQEKVKNYADILVLIIGGRCGFVDEKTNKSVTNLEYLEARRKGIPIYVFVDKNVLSLIGTWKKNPSADFSSNVDNNAVFHFIEQVRSIDSVWTFPFEHANDITNTLSIQFAYLFKTTLNDHKKLNIIQPNLLLNDLGAVALRLVIEKLKAWEYKLFYQVWIDEINKKSEKIFQYQNNIKVGNWEFIKFEDSANWISLKFHEVSGWLENGTILINEIAPKAFGAPGVAGNEIEIIMTAKNIVNLICTMIDWIQKLRVIKINEPFDRVIETMIKLPEKMIEDMLSFPKVSLLELEEALLAARPDEIIKITRTLKMNISNLEEFEKAFAYAKDFFKTQ